MELFKQIILFRNRGIAKVSVQDYSRVSRYRWVLSNGYASAWIKGKRVYLHRFVLGVTNPAIQVDHRKGNKLDCRRSQLRKCSNAQNQHNRHKAVAKSGYKGVHYFAGNKSNPWMATIRVRYKTHHLGYFCSAEAAAWVYDQAAVKYFKEFACINGVSKPSRLRAVVVLQHRVKRSGSTSTFKGVSFRPAQTLRPWVAQFSTKFLGSFRTERLAALAYNKEAFSVLGKHALLNSL